MSAAAAACLSKSLRLSSTLKIEEEAINMKKQGIGSILGSDSEKPKSSSLRRTLSADMSSTKWLAQHGFSPMKKIASSEEFPVSSITDSDGEEEGEDRDHEPPSQFDIWTSIISQKEKEALPPPYIHPLVKSSSSSLSEKSLEVCTENLGSETGCDGFSSYPSSETGTDLEEDHKEIDQEQQQQQPLQESFDVVVEDEDDIEIPKYNYNAVVGKKYSPQQRSFPPPIPSLSGGDGSASIRMQSRRDNGRLVLEAVSVPTNNNFRAQRQDGRLVLTFIDAHSSTDHQQQLPNKEEEDVFDNNFEQEEEDDEVDREIEEEEEEEEEDKEMQFVMEKEKPPKLSGGVISLHRLTLMMNNKHLGLANKNQTWPNKFNEVVKFDDSEEIIDQPTMVAQSLPPPPTMARMIPKPPVKEAAAAAATTAGVSFNAYEYYWRPKPGKGNNGKLIINSKNPMENYEQKELLVIRGNKGDYLVPMLKSCKEPRRSLLFWEPHCIATS